MKELIGAIGDRVQALFPPNRVAILLSGVITALSGSIAAWLAAHAPGLEFGQLEIAGVLGAAVIITVRLLDRWFDQWQKGEPVNYQADFDQALEELANSPEAHVFYEALGTMHGVGDSLADLRARIEAGTVNEAEIANGLAAIHDVVARWLHEHTELEQQAPPVAVDAPAEAAPAPAE